MEIYLILKNETILYSFFKFRIIETSCTQSFNLCFFCKKKSNSKSKQKKKKKRNFNTPADPVSLQTNAHYDQNSLSNTTYTPIHAILNTIQTQQSITSRQRFDDTLNNMRNWPRSGTTLFERFFSSPMKLSTILSIFSCNWGYYNCFFFFFVMIIKFLFHRFLQFWQIEPTNENLWKTIPTHWYYNAMNLRHESTSPVKQIKLQHMWRKRKKNLYHWFHHNWDDFQH